MAVHAPQAAAQASECSFRGALDDACCDDNRDLVADPPRDPARFRDPSTLVFADTPVEDPALHASQLRPFMEYLTRCTGKRAVHFPVTLNAAQIEAMRSARLHIAGFSTGPTAFAVNLAGAMPRAVKGKEHGCESHRLAVVVRADPPLRQMSGLKGKHVAHIPATSNSGNLVPRAFFPELGQVPDQDHLAETSADAGWFGLTAAMCSRNGGLPCGAARFAALGRRLQTHLCCQATSGSAIPPDPKLLLVPAEGLEPPTP